VARCNNDAGWGLERPGEILGNSLVPGSEGILKKIRPACRSRGFRVAIPFAGSRKRKGCPEINKENTVNSRNMIRVAVLGIVCLLGNTAVRAQAAAGSAATGKIGVINVRQAIVTTAEGKQASAELQSQFAARQNELESLNKQINDLRQRLQAGTATLSDEEKDRLTRQGQKLTQQLDRKQNELQEDVNTAQGDVVDRIGRKMMDVLDRYARENGIVAVFDSSAQNTPILFASTNIDITQDIIKLYDQAYPIKASVTAPAQPKQAASVPKPANPSPTKP
jgi:outer membrane protein